MKRYKNLFIDLDDTLYDFHAASRAAFEETYALLEYDRFFDGFDHYMRIYTPFNLEMWRIYGAGEITKDELNRRRFLHPLTVVGAGDEQLAERFCREALGRIPYKNFIIDGATDLLEYLYPKYSLYILSNGFQELQSKKMATAGFTKFFRRLVLSDEIGINKPRRELFDYALQVTGSSVENSIMIGDMFDTDIAGAANVGMDQIFFNPRHEDKKPFAPTYEVHCLSEIKEIL